MKFKEFMAALEGGVKHAYLLAGEEIFYIDRAREKILHKLGIGADLVTLDCDDKIPAAEIANAIDSAPLFTERNVVLVKNAPFFGADAKTDRLEKILADMLPTNYVIFTAKAADKRRRLYKIIAKVGAVLEAEPLRPWQVDDWLNDKLRALGKNMSPAARKYFAERIAVLPEISLWYLENELDKIALNVTGREITAKDLERNMLEMPEVSNFAVLDAIDAKKVQPAVKILRTQLRDKNKIPAALAIIVRHVRQLLHAKILTGRGVKGRAFAEKLEMNPYIAQKFEKTAATYPAELLEEIFLDLADADFKLKSGRVGAEILERIVYKLARR